MKTYNFDIQIDRKKTDSYKWNLINEDIIPLWVADMDFQVADEIIDAIISRAKHPVFGYNTLPESYYKAFINWYDSVHETSIDKDWICFTPGVISGLGYIIDAFSSINDDIIIQTPVYPEFREVIDNKCRNVIENKLIHRDGNYFMDFENLENIITQKTKMLILCNPHNPVGRSWSKEELFKLGSIAIKHNIIIVSDEVHSDMVFEPNKHRLYWNVSEDFYKHSIICTSPNKTFNIAGLQTANILIKESDLREKFKRTLLENNIYGGNIFGVVAQESAYTYGYDWYIQVKDYIEKNIDFVINYIKSNIPIIKVHKPEATYLLWLDFRSLNMKHEDLDCFLKNDCKVLLNDGSNYSEDYNGFMRMNVATNRKTLKKALCQIESSINKII